MTSTYRFVITADGALQNFLSLKETRAGDLIISTRGRQNRVPVGSELGAAKVEAGTITTSSITVHPNLKSEIGSITINYKDNVGGKEGRTVAGVLDVKSGNRLFPVITSIGRNLAVPGLTIERAKFQGASFIELWETAGIELARNSLAYSVFVANRNARLVFPEDFPRNVVCLAFQHFQVVFIYWLFNQPTKSRGTTLTFSTPEKYVSGFEFHEALNFTNDVTVAHSRVYHSLPEFH